MSLKVLLADTGDLIKKMLEESFADMSIDLKSVKTGSEALIELKEYFPDVLIADVGLKGVDGYSLCEMVKQDQELRQMRVVLIHDSFTQIDQDKLEEVGVDAELAKPLNVDDLINYFSVWNLYEESKSPDQEMSIHDVNLEEDNDATSMIESIYDDTSLSGSDETIVFETVESPELDDSVSLDVDSTLQQDSDDLAGEIITSPASMAEMSESGEDDFVSIDEDVDSGEVTIDAAPDPFFEESSEDEKVDLLNESDKENSEMASIDINDMMSSEKGKLLVEEIVRHVSDKVIREIAWEVVPELAEKIIKETLEKITTEK